MARTKILPVGYTIQLYRQAGGFSMEKLAADLDLYKSVGITGIAPHGFVGEMDIHKFDTYVQLAKPKGLKCYAAFGLAPNDPYTKGVWMGKVAQHPDCAGVLFDMEGAFEIAAGKAAANSIGQGFVAQFPNSVRDVWTCDQPWSEPTVHWSLFPYEEIAQFVDARAAQFYFNDNVGPLRYTHFDPVYHHSWDVLNKRLAQTNSVRPLMMTLQAYAWADILPSYVACLLENPTTFMWCDRGLPTPNSLLGLAIVKKLADLGYKAVVDFQKAYNLTKPTVKLAEDDSCGYLTAAALLGREITTAEKTNP
jgi:hypothetical protein